ncbi:phosphatase PAP2 family protein, partial [Streptomyces chartreusis]|uniref:phosphatase PAP2 family protein n=2 Tax=Streptomyces TaxID=1883 RepID=UPI00343D1CF3
MPHADIAGVEATPRTRLRWWTELPLILLVYACYSAGRLLARGDVSTAVDHGLAILDIEKALYLNAEHPLNRLFTSEPWIGVPADFWYASLHYLITPVLLVWLFRSRTVHYRAARTWLMTSTFIGLIGFTL